MDNFDTKNAISGSAVPLGLISDRPSYFVLSGSNGSYNSIGDVQNWMQKNLNAIGHRKIRDICIPASHDSGMSKVPWATKFAAAGSIATQFVSVEDQLRLGVRYLDIRPVLHKGIWVCGHYSFIDPKWLINPPPLDTWQGGNGEAIQEVIDGINRYTANSNELIVLSVSHTKIINDAFGSYARNDFEDLDKSSWIRLLDIFTHPESGIKFLWKPTYNSVSCKDLTDLSLHNYIGGGSSAVLILIDDGVDASGRPGVFNNTCWPFEYSGWSKSESERLTEFQQYMLQINPKPFGFSGCHMQTDSEAIMTTLGQSSASVLSLATESKHRLFSELFPLAAKDGKYPSALTMDAIDSSDLAALCMAINDCWIR